MHKSKFGMKRINLKTHEIWADRRHQVFAFEKKSKGKK
jgi:hypothetical protein